MIDIKASRSVPCTILLLTHRPIKLWDAFPKLDVSHNIVECLLLHSLFGLLDKWNTNKISVVEKQQCSILLRLSNTIPQILKDEYSIF